MLIRRANSGRRSIAGRIKWASQNPPITEKNELRVFLQVLELWFIGWNSGRPAAEIQRALEALGRHPAEGLIPWLRLQLDRYSPQPSGWKSRDYYRGMGILVGQRPLPRAAGSVFRVTWRPQWIIDWYLATHPNIMSMTLEEAVDASIAWHEEMAARAAERAFSPAAIKEAFPHVLHEWPDGTTLRMLKPDVLHPPDPLPTFRAIGKALGHCYQHADTAWGYATDGPMLVYFTPDLKAFATAACRVRGSVHAAAYGITRGPSVTVTELRGTQNRFPDEKYWKYLRELTVQLNADLAFGPEQLANMKRVGWSKAEMLEDIAARPGTLHEAKAAQVLALWAEAH